MHIPTTLEDLICELQTFLHGGQMDDDEQAFFETHIQNDPEYMLGILGEDAIGALCFVMHQFLVAGVQLHRIDDFGSLIPRIWAGRRHIHQMRHFSEMHDTSAQFTAYSAFLDDTKDVEDADEIITNDFMFQFMRETPNKYLLIIAILSAVQEGFDEAYQDYVKGKISLFTFTLAFWRPMESLFEPDCPANHVMWMDLLCDSVGPKMSRARLQEMLRAAEAAGA